MNNVKEEYDTAELMMKSKSWMLCMDEKDGRWQIIAVSTGKAIVYALLAIARAIQEK